MSEHIEHLGAVREPMGSIDLGTILLLGEDNPISSSPEFQLYPRPIGCSGERLQTHVLGLSEPTYLAIWRTNLCTPTWDSGAARRRAWTLLGDAVPWTTIVMLGRKVASSFEVAHPTVYHPTLLPFTSGQIDTGGRMFTLISLPHPSGRCKEWLVTSAFKRAQRLMRLHNPTIPWGGAIL